MGYWKYRWIQTPQRILMDPCIKQAPVLSKWFWIIPWPLAYNRLELDCIRKIINFWYTFGWKWRVFVTIWDCRTNVRMTSMTSSVERTDLDFKISVALFWGPHIIFISKPGINLNVIIISLFQYILKVKTYNINFNVYFSCVNKGTIQVLGYLNILKEDISNIKKL